jgi:hypothetical protein
MNTFGKSLIALMALSVLLFTAQTLNAQKQTYQEFTGNLISINGPGVGTGTFTLRINSLTSDQQARNFLGILRDNGQDNLLSAIQKEDLGRFSVNTQLARTVNVVRESRADGKLRVFVVFERWTQFAEVRGGYRSLDYPFGVIEMFIDEKTGKGEGTYIAAARITWDNDKKTKIERVEIENFATYPVKLVEVTGKIRGGVR